MSIIMDCFLLKKSTIIIATIEEQCEGTDSLGRCCNEKWLMVEEEI